MYLQMGILHLQSSRVQVEVAGKVHCQRDTLQSCVDTSPMIIVAYAKGTPPPKLQNPVGQWYKYKYNGEWYHRQCKKLLLPPKDDTGIYLDLGDSNEPIKNLLQYKYFSFFVNDLYPRCSVSLEVWSLSAASVHALANYGRVLDATLSRRTHRRENIHER